MPYKSTLGADLSRVESWAGEQEIDVAAQRGRALEALSGTIGNIPGAIGEAVELKKQREQQEKETAHRNWQMAQDLTAAKKAEQDDLFRERAYGLVGRYTDDIGLVNWQAAEDDPSLSGDGEEATAYRAFFSEFKNTTISSNMNMVNDRMNLEANLGSTIVDTVDGALLGDANSWSQVSRPKLLRTAISRLTLQGRGADAERLAQEMIPKTYAEATEEDVNGNSWLSNMANKNLSMVEQFDRLTAQQNLAKAMLDTDNMSRLDAMNYLHNQTAKWYMRGDTILRNLETQEDLDAFLESQGYNDPKSHAITPEIREWIKFNNLDEMGDDEDPEAYARKVNDALPREYRLTPAMLKGSGKTQAEIYEEIFENPAAYYASVVTEQCPGGLEEGCKAAADTKAFMNRYRQTEQGMERASAVWVGEELTANSLAETNEMYATELGELEARLALGRSSANEYDQTALYDVQNAGTDDEYAITTRPGGEEVRLNSDRIGGRSYQKAVETLQAKRRDLLRLPTEADSTFFLEQVAREIAGLRHEGEDGEPGAWVQPTYKTVYEFIANDAALSRFLHKPENNIFNMFNVRGLLTIGYRTDGTTGGSVISGAGSQDNVLDPRSEEIQDIRELLEPPEESNP